MPYKTILHCFVKYQRLCLSISLKKTVDGSAKKGNDVSTFTPKMYFMSLGIAQFFFLCFNFLLIISIAILFTH